MASAKQIAFPIVVVIIAAAGFFGLNYFKQPVEEKEVVDFTPLVKTAPLAILSYPLTVYSQGMVEPKEQTQLIAQVGGQVSSISNKFIKGEFVAKGTVLLNIDSSDYISSLVEAQANLAAARAALQLEKARGHVAQSEWEKINNAKPSELGLRKPQLAQEVAKVRAAQAIVQKAQRNLDRTAIVAPYDAIINTRSVSLGSVVNYGSTIGLLSATSVGTVRLPIADKDLAFLNNNAIGAGVDLYSNFNGKRTAWQGHVVRNEGVIDKASRMHYLVVEVATPYALEKPLRFGSYVTANIKGQTLDNVAIVPRHLVIENKLAILANDSTLHFKDVVTVREQGETVVISGDFDTDSQYITSALSYPIEGMSVSVKSTKDVL